MPAWREKGSVHRVLGLGTVPSGGEHTGPALEVKSLGKSENCQKKRPRQEVWAAGGKSP